jgi:mycothiol synthase
VRPPEPFTAREATGEDAEEIAAIFEACERAYSPEPARFGEREIVMWLERGVASVVVEEGGVVVAGARALLRGEALSVEGVTLPEKRGLGLGAFLVDWSEEQARRQHVHVLRSSVYAGDERAHSLLGDRGFRPVRSFYRMVIDLPSAPPAPAWPDGITIRRLRHGEERLLHVVIEDSFAEHWGHERRDFDEWRRGHPIEYDVTFLARDEDQVAGTVVCHEELFGEAFVGILGVRTPWRGRGLGRALLLHGLGALYDHGRRRVALGVDAGNETGALELYHSVGMRVASQDDVYERRG